MPATSPAIALNQILHGPAKTANPDIVVLDYRHEATFRALWLDGFKSGTVTNGGREKEIDLTDPSRQFLIIGNDPPDGIFDTKMPALSGINFRSHFTATSWLATWKVRFGEKKKFTTVEGQPPSAGTSEARQPVSNLIELHNITIHSPMNLGDWLKPFGETGTDENAIERVSGLIASEPLKNKVKAVFGAASDDVNMPGAISNFEKALSEDNKR